MSHNIDMLNGRAKSARFDSSQFGSGAAMKAKAWNLLHNMERTLAAQDAEPQGVPIPASFAAAL